MSVGQGIRGGQSRRLPPRAPELAQPGGRRPTPPVLRANGEDQSPLAEQRAVGGPQRMACVVDAGGLGGRPVQFDDLKTAPRPQVLLRSIANVVAANKEAIETPRDVGDAPLECFRPKAPAVLEYA